MKYIKVLLGLAVILLFLAGCAKENIYIVKTYEATDPDLYESYIHEGRVVTTDEYYELSDGSFRTEDGKVYKYRLVIEGRMHAAVRDSVFVILSNREDITFDMAWKASGFSSNLDDYFDPDEAIIVGRG